jgi:hypothetical protein
MESSEALPLHISGILSLHSFKKSLTNRSEFVPCCASSIKAPNQGTHLGLSIDVPTAVTLVDVAGGLS